MQMLSSSLTFSFLENSSASKHIIFQTYTVEINYFLKCSEQFDLTLISGYVPVVWWIEFLQKKFAVLMKNLLEKKHSNFVSDLITNAVRIFFIWFIPN